MTEKQPGNNTPASLGTFFTMGKFYLFANNVENSFNAYARAIDLCRTKKDQVLPQHLDREIEWLNRFARNEQTSQHVNDIESLLQVAKFSFFRDNKSQKYLKTKVRRSKKFQLPLLIIAGGALGMPTNQFPLYLQMLSAGLKLFQGTVISGGTSSGIPGLVGTVTGQAAGRQYKLIGYIPKKMPAQIEKDANYDELIQTNGADFSVREPIQYWLDIAMNDVEPGEVKLLGIHGGQIAAFEYRLALALGARVALLASSGGTATELMQNDDWRNHPNLFILPQEPEAISKNLKCFKNL